MAVSGSSKLSRRRDLQRSSRARSAAIAALSLLATGAVAAGCTSDATSVVRTAPPPKPRELGLRAFGPARYLEQVARWVERTPGGTDYAVLSSRRIELSGAKVVKSAPGDVEIEGATPLPAWIKGPAR